MTDLAVISVDTHRLDLRFGRRILAYAVNDAYGWVLMARPYRKSRVKAFDRFEPDRGDRPGELRRAVCVALSKYGQAWAERHHVDAGDGSKGPGRPGTGGGTGPGKPPPSSPPSRPPVGPPPAPPPPPNDVSGPGPGGPSGPAGPSSPGVPSSPGKEWPT